MKKIYLFAFTIMSALSFGQTIHLNDAFNYADNSLLTANGWTAHSGSGTQAIDVGASNGLTYAGYNDGAASITGATPGNAARLDNNGEDVNKSFTSVTSGTIYFSFLLNVANATSGHFIHLSNISTGANQYARVSVRPSTINATTKFNIGISNTATAVYGASELDLNTTYLVIVKYDVTTAGATSLWIKSSGVPATEAAAGTAEVTNSGSGSATIDRFCLRQYNASQNQTVDAVFVASTWLGTAACALNLGAETATCNAITSAIDTYNITIPFTGGGSGSYTLATNTGVIGGDNPNAVAAGNITITGVNEGTTVNFNITGSCTLSKTIASPNCKPINTLPFSEPFNYPATTTLNSTQLWNVVNTGDDIVSEAGNLTYTGITSSGNRVTFAGAGAESVTPFTSTTSGAIYARFLYSVTDLTGYTAGASSYAVGLTDNVRTSATVARVWIKENAGQYQYGLSSTTNAANIVWSPNLYNVGTTQYLLLAYDFGNNTLSLFENPTLPSTTTPTVSLNPATAIANLGGFILRQDTAATTPVTVVDELLINTVAPDGLTLSRNSFDAIAGLQVYPNPAKNLVNITSNSFAPKNVEIYNVVGTKVLATTVTNAPVNVAGLTTGIYMVKVTEEGKTATRKLVIE